jgi:hypothetical protein
VLRVCLRVLIACANHVADALFGEWVTLRVYAHVGTLDYMQHGVNSLIAARVTPASLAVEVCVCLHDMFLPLMCSVSWRPRPLRHTQPNLICLHTTHTVAPPRHVQYLSVSLLAADLPAGAPHACSTAWYGRPGYCGG